VSDRTAWATSGVEQITAAVYRIPLPLPTDALRAVNVYAIRGSAGTGLIDGGWFLPDALDTLRHSLAEIDIRIDEITRVLATHFHRDHYTLAVELRRITGCGVSLGIGERASVEAILAGISATDRFAEQMRRAGAPQSLQDVEYARSNVSTEYAHPNSWLVDGDRPMAGGRELVALSTPGHTNGHFCFADDEGAMLFAGDHVLPHITPSIGFETVPAHLPLANYLGSLRRVRERRDAVLLPAHGPVAPSVHTRIDELLAHHADRLDRCGDAIAAGARTAYQVAVSIPWTRHARALGEMSAFDQVSAIQETTAHLDVLRMQRRLETRTVAGVDDYVTV
jgi:glyoxylase-like metal-dependent hydrolase (beta-lactamase superfamily II)